MLRHPCILGDPQRQARGAKSEVVPNKEEQNQKWLPHTCLLGGPKEVSDATSPLHSRGSPTKGNEIRSGYITPAFRGGRKRAVMLHQPAFSRVDNAKRGEQNQKWSTTKGTKSEVAASPLPSRGPKGGRRCYVTPAFSGVPNKQERNQKWLPHPCLLGGPKEGRDATSPLHSWASPTTGNKIRSGYLTPTFWGPKRGP